MSLLMGPFYTLLNLDAIISDHFPLKPMFFLNLFQLLDDINPSQDLIYSSQESLNQTVQ